MAKLVNPTLYQRLVEVFGRKGVRIHRPGRRGSFKYDAADNGKYSAMRLVKAGREVGEEFSVSCLFCGDTRGRLYFNHFWGTRNKYDGKRILWPCHCYNEECQADFENRKELARLILGSDRVRLTLPENEVDEEPEERTVKLPGVLQDIGVLAKESLEHPAVQWCLERGYNPQELSERYGVGFCAFPHRDGHPCRNRIVAPFYMRSNGETKLAGWTARKIYSDTPGPKWLHSASPTGDIVYGLGSAAQYETLVIVEGPGDVWSTGPWSCALFGKTLNDAKLSRIVKALDKWQTRNRVVVVMLDPKQSSIERQRGREHHIKAAVKALKSVLTCPIIPVILPAFTDPGELDRAILRWHIKQHCKEDGIVPSFGKVSYAKRKGH